MTITNLRRLTWKLATRLGGPFRKWAWNDQYSRGRWQHITSARSPTMVRLVEELAGGGDLAELACGEGTLACCVAPEAYSTYWGTDVSQVAVDRARAKADSLGLAGCRFEVCDMTHWQADGAFSLIIIEEALNYLAEPAQVALLQRCLQHLGPSGRLLVTFHSTAKHAAAIATCKRVCETDREVLEGERAYLVLRQRLPQANIVAAPLANSSPPRP